MMNKKMMRRFAGLALVATFSLPAIAQASPQNGRKVEKAAVKDIKRNRRDNAQDVVALRRLQTDLRAAVAAGDQARIARDRIAIRQLQIDMKVNRAEIVQDKVAVGTIERRRQK
jgi:hypothetical protein